MKSIYALVIVIFCIFTTAGQTDDKPFGFNFGFEKVSAGAKLLDQWSLFGKGYD